MKDNSIWERIEEENKNNGISAKLYRYTGIIKAIEFFSQRLSFDQIMDLAFELVNELLTIEKSIGFMNSNDGIYFVKNNKGFSEIEIPKVEDTKELRAGIIFHGALITDNSRLKKVFGETIIDQCGICIGMPLFVETDVYGFILLAKKAIGEFDQDDKSILEALMKLFNNAIENYKKYEDLNQANLELDDKIFNLFAINQSSKVLLSELNLENLYTLSVDVFSELTQSVSTSFILYNDKSENYKIEAYKNLYNYPIPDKNISFVLNSDSIINKNKTIIDLFNDDDIKYFEGLFKNSVNYLRSYGSKYVVLLINNEKVLGFVTLGESVTQKVYKDSIFELIESLASSVYIAVSNASLFEEVNRQKDIIQSKLNKLTSLNKLMKNINSSANVSTLLDITLDTLEISFDIDKALIVLYDKGSNIFNIMSKKNIETDVDKIPVNSFLQRVLDGETIYQANEEDANKCLPSPLSDDIKEKSGILIIPIYIERIDKLETIGAVMIFKYGNDLLITNEEQILTVQTIASHIAPVLNSLFTIENHEKFLLPDYVELFKTDLKNSISTAQELSTSLIVIKITDNRDFIFEKNYTVDLIKSEFDRVYPLSFNDIFILLDDHIDNIEYKIKAAVGFDDLIVKTYRFGEHFNSYKDFFKLF